MTDYALARENMIESQVRPNGVTDHRIIDALYGLARETFVPDSRRAVAYVDEDVEVAPGRFDFIFVPPQSAVSAGDEPSAAVRGGCGGGSCGSCGG